MDTNTWGLSFHHLGLAVPEPESAIRFLKGLNYQIGDLVYDPRQDINLILCRSSEMPVIEIVFPAKVPSVIDKILEKNRDGGIYHTCFESQNVQESLSSIKRDGIRFITILPPTPAILFEHRPVSFYLVQGYGIIEILEAKPIRP